MPVNPPAPPPKPTERAKAALVKADAFVAIALAVFAGYLAATPFAIVGVFVAAAALAVLAGPSSK